MDILDIVKSELGITGSEENDYLNRKINGFKSLLERVTGRTFGIQENYTEILKVPLGQKRLILTSKVLPLTQINDIYYGAEQVDPSTYEIENATLGFIRTKRGFWRSTGWGYGDTINYFEHEHEFFYTVDFNGGEEMPLDVEDALVEAVKSAYTTRDVSENITSIKVGDASTSFGSKTSTGLPPSLDAVVNRYKTVEVL